MDAALILAGGAGTRFWPLSTEARPKQLLPLLGERTLLQQAVDRVVDLVPRERILVLTSASLASSVRAQLPDVPPGQVISEPFRRDTAAAVALGTALLRRLHGDLVVGVLTADHHVAPMEGFHATLEAASRAARGSDALYTIAVAATWPCTAYGWLELGEELTTLGRIAQHRVARFHEKPDAATAQTYLAAGHAWNSGMFVWRASSLLAEVERQLPDHHARIGEAVRAWATADWPDALAAAFEPLPSVSIDRGVLEGAREVRCVEADFSWSDVGGWEAVAELLPELDGNRVRGEVYALEATDNLVICEDPAEYVALIGVRGLVVVRANGRTLVMSRDKAQMLKALVASLPERAR